MCNLIEELLSKEVNDNSEQVHSSVFDELIDRKNSNSMKWDYPHKYLKPHQCAVDPLPMWVADMDFRAPEPVINALHNAVEHGIFGYSGGVRQSYVDAIIAWQRKRFGWDVNAEWLVHTSGVITTIKTAIQAFTAPGDSVLIQPPVYIHFHDDPRFNGRHLAYAPLDYINGRYHFNAEKFEAAICDNTRLFILSNPHNPTGNVWTVDELRAMGEICSRHNIIVLSDEIHQDFILNPECKHTPFATVNQICSANSLICTAPSKTFNMPGLQIANIIIPDAHLRNLFSRQLERNIYRQVNALGMIAAEAAYTHGEPWLNALLDYVRQNHRHLSDSIHAATDKLKVLQMDSLYLAWIDCRGLGMDADSLENFMLTDARVWLDKGLKFGKEGEGFMRINLGCSRSTLNEAISRILSSIHHIENK